MAVAGQPSATVPIITHPRETRTRSRITAASKTASAIYHARHYLEYLVLRARVHRAAARGRVGHVELEDGGGRRLVVAGRQEAAVLVVNEPGGSHVALHKYQRSAREQFVDLYNEFRFVAQNFMTSAGVLADFEPLPTSSRLSQEEHTSP